MTATPSGIAQSTDDPEAGAADAPIVDAQAIELDSIALLEFRTYERSWVRYRNADAAGNRLLAIEGISKFPFRSVSHRLRVTMENLQTPSILGGIVAARGMAYSADAMTGNCLTEALVWHGVTDILCQPGSSAMTPGHAISVIYHPETGEIVAVTTSVDNTGGVASRIETVVAAPATDPQPAGGEPAAEAPDAPAEQMPAGESMPTTCGPWTNNQWLDAREYWNSGLDLPIDFSQTGYETPDYFHCIVPGGGSHPYLRAGIDIEPTTTPTEPPEGSSSDDDDDDDDDDSGPCLPGQTYQEPYEPGDPPICY